jgi:hypothetical protein
MTFGWILPAWAFATLAVFLLVRGASVLNAEQEETA